MFCPVCGNVGGTGCLIVDCISDRVDRGNLHCHVFFASRDERNVLIESTACPAVASFCAVFRKDRLFRTYFCRRWRMGAFICIYEYCICRAGNYGSRKGRDGSDQKFAACCRNSLLLRCVCYGRYHECRRRSAYSADAVSCRHEE